MLLARIYQAFPLVCPHGGADLRIIAFLTEAASVHMILEHIGEPATPPRIASGDPLAQPEPEYEFAQRVTW